MGCEIESHQLWSWIDRSAPELDEHIASCDPCRRQAALVQQQADSLRMDAGQKQRIPDSIGRYTPVEVIGRGGMGIVYRAIQPETERQVAVKVMWDALDGEERFTQYFKREVKAMGRLGHPNIARVFESGQTADGKYFLVMELLDGMAIDRYVRLHRPSRMSLLKLFVSVCDGIAHAHANGVLHRDIKPSNVMVTPKSTAHVLDFGLAHVSNTHEPGAPPQTTSFHHMGTFPYMSPERLDRREATATARSDVYSLGVVLFELLTGRLPFRLGPSHKAAVETICRGEYERPDSVDQSIDQDLSAIIETAIESDPQRRYTSVAAMRDDLVSYLANRPIRARPPSTWYRLRKAVRRNRTSFTVASSIFLILLASTVVSTRLFLRSRAEANHAHQIGSFLESVLTAANPNLSGPAISVRQMLDHASGRLKSESEIQPQARSSLHRTLGLTYLGQGVYRDAEEHLQTAMDIRQARFGQSSIEYAESLSDLGEFANVRYDPRRARPLFEDALAIYQSAPRHDHAAIARCLNGLGGALFTLGTYHSSGPVDGRTDQDCYRDAEAAFTEAITILESQGLAVPASYYQDLGGAQRRRGNYTDSEASYLEGIQVCRQSFGEESVAEALVRFEYAQLLEDRRQFEAAERMFRKAIDVHRKLLGDRHPTRVLMLARFADFLCLKLGAYPEAEELYLDALHTRSQFADGRRFRNSAIKYERRLSVLYARWGKFEHAIDIIRDRTDRAIKSPHKGNLIYMILTGEAYMAAGRLSEADTQFQAVLDFVDTVQPRVGSVDTLHARTLIARSRILNARGQFTDAEMLARTSLEIVRSILPATDSRVGDSLSALGEHLTAQEKYKEAEPLLRQCLEIRRRTLPEQHHLIRLTQRLHRTCVDAMGIRDSRS